MKTIRLTSYGSIVGRDILDMWEHPGQEEFATQVLIAEIGPDFDIGTHGSAYEAFSDRREHDEREMARPFWPERRRLPFGFHEVQS